MSGDRFDVAERSQRLARVFAERRARLAADLVRGTRRLATPAAPHPLARLQHRGYPVALSLALAAASPTVLRFLFRRRKLLVRAATAVLRVRQWRTRLAGGRPTAVRRAGGRR